MRDINIHRGNRENKRDNSPRMNTDKDGRDTGKQAGKNESAAPAYGKPVAGQF